MMVGVFDGVDVQYFGVVGGEFEYFFVGDVIEFLCFWDYVWVCGEDVVDVVVDFVYVGVEGGCQSDCCGV